MKIYNQDKTKELFDVDLELGKLKKDFITIPEVQAVQEQYHYEVIKEYENGGKDVEKVIDVAEVKYQPERQEEIMVYIPYTITELEEIELNKLRERRDIECFSIINRGKLWYDNLTEQQIAELNVWYHQWLDVTITKVIPQMPNWLVQLI